MRIAFTGTASTGKTTLIKELSKNEKFRQFNYEFLTTNARSILDSLGFKQMDLMTKEQKIHFQKLYFKKKREIESNRFKFIVDRSFVDVASYWLVRDCDNNIFLADNLINEARILAKSYDLHFYFPYGIIPFEDDGYRSRDELQREHIDEQIKHFLDEWDIRYFQFTTSDIDERVAIVLNELSLINSRHEK